MPRRPQQFVVAVGGTDPSGSAGLLADVRTLEAFGVPAAAVVTAVTVQDGVRPAEVERVPARIVARQLACVLESLPVAVVKLGMLTARSTVAAVAAELEAAGVAIVLDPVVQASAGGALAEPGLAAALARDLLPLAPIVTANLAEAGTLADMHVDDEASMVEAGHRIVALGARAAVIKGGHLRGDPVDVLCYRGRTLRYRSRRLGKVDLHGSGCAFASALAAGLARRRSLARSVIDARKHVRQLIAGAARTRGGAWLRMPPARGPSR